MTEYEVVFSADVDADFESILNYIAADNPYRAISFVDELQTRVHDLLSSQPNAGPRTGRYRYVPFGNYVVVYSVDIAAARVRVVLVSEGHRDWRRLLDDRLP